MLYSGYSKSMFPIHLLLDGKHPYLRIHEGKVWHVDPDGTLWRIEDGMSDRPGIAQSNAASAMTAAATSISDFWRQLPAVPTRLLKGKSEHLSTMIRHMHPAPSSPKSIALAPFLPEVVLS